MTVTSTGLIKAAAAAAVTAGTIFVAVQINHPATGTFITETHLSLRYLLPIHTE